MGPGEGSQPLVPGTLASECRGLDGRWRPGLQIPRRLAGWGRGAGCCSLCWEPLAQFPGSPALPQDSCSGCARTSGPGVGGGLLEAGEEFPPFPPTGHSRFGCAFNSMGRGVPPEPHVRSRRAAPAHGRAEAHMTWQWRPQRCGEVPSSLSLCCCSQIVSCPMPTPMAAPSLMGGPPRSQASVLGALALEVSSALETESCSNG